MVKSQEFMTQSGQTLRYLISNSFCVYYYQPMIWKPAQ
jgi:hypothetical protein